ncbi:MAG: VanW family protein [Patescibacteria group bacterium]|jgi:vancomycin resistance protein YoaR
MTEPTEKKRRLTEAHKKAIGVTFFCITILGVMILLIISANIALAKTFENRMYRNVSVAGIPIGGMSKDRATQTLQDAYNHMIAGGLIVELYNETKTVDLAPAGATDPDLVYPLIDSDIQGAVEAAYKTGRTGDTLADYFGPLWFSTFGQRLISPTITVAETKLADSIRSVFPDAESSGAPTNFVVEGTKAPYVITVSPAVSGATLDLSAAFEKIKRDARDFSISPVDLALSERAAVISQAEAESLIANAEKALEGGPYTLSFTNEYKQRFTFPVTVENLKTWLLPTKTNNRPALTLDTEAMKPLFDDIHAKLDISAHDAVFETDGNRVTKFEPSREGLRVDDDALIRSLVAAFGSDLREVSLSVMVTEPEITTAESNTLGIKEVLGTGVSKYSGSPANRRKNIQHGVDKLYGIIVAPGETLSLIEELGPFTAEDGYFPELVIKGDEIKPEIGGGLCQIGTTTFRAAMNSGLDIAERRNHSLVVTYYNDLANGKPGTDATIYDPAPDLKIHNDTATNIVLLTQNDTSTSTLSFSFWGTSDGREGSYTPPIVLNWIGAGEKVTKETDSLPAGVTKCQAAHPGANTIFTYNISRADGTVTTRDFPSTYRALPTICLVGKDPNAPPPVVAGTTDPVPLDVIPEGVPVE